MEGVKSVGELQIQTAQGTRIINNNDKILIHEHIFNRYPYWRQKQMESFLLKELIDLHKLGVSMVFDLTPYTKVYNYYNVIDESPVTIASCIGFYTPRYVPADLRNSSTSTLVSLLSNRIEKGVGRRRIKPSILKVAAQKDELSDIEEKFFRVVSILSDLYHMPIALHAPKESLSHVRRLVDMGANPRLIMVAHIENGISKDEEYEKRIKEAKEIMNMGAYIQLADFGSSLRSAKCNRALSFIQNLILEGYLPQLLVSGDSNWRWKNNQFRVKDYHLNGGKHYSYTCNFTLPLLQKQNATIDIERILLTENPLKFLGGL